MIRFITSVCEKSVFNTVWCFFCFIFVFFFAPEFELFISDNIITVGNSRICHDLYRNGLFVLHSGFNLHKSR